MTEKSKAKAIVLIEKLRLIESELYKLISRYGVRTVEDLDRLVEKGKVAELDLGEDLFVFDYLILEKEKTERELGKLDISKARVWESFQGLLGLPKLSFRR